MHHSPDNNDQATRPQSLSATSRPGDQATSCGDQATIETPPPVVETKQPVVETKQPVMETKQPVTETEAPVVETKQPVLETRQPVLETDTQKPWVFSECSTAQMGLVTVAIEAQDSLRAKYLENAY